jgi:hypothetical protein
MQSHVPLKRLLAVAADNLIFTLEEFNHLKECEECFTRWSEFIEVRNGTFTCGVSVTSGPTSNTHLDNHPDALLVSRLPSLHVGLQPLG